MRVRKRESIQSLAEIGGYSDGVGAVGQPQSHRGLEPYAKGALVDLLRDESRASSQIGSPPFVSRLPPAVLPDRRRRRIATHAHGHSESPLKHSVQIRQSGVRDRTVPGLL